MYVSTQEELSALIDMMRGASVLAVDTEFHREKTYYPKFCLLQLATDEVSAIVDPLALSDLSPLRELLEDPSTCKVFHAGRQDIGLLIREVGCSPYPVFDTQIAAGVLGHPQQMGYGALVKAFMNISLDKADSFTDWTMRPLSATQVEYAIGDVLYLPAIYRKMTGQLEELGRSSWLTSEFEDLRDPANYEVDVEESWRKVKRISSLTRKQLAVVMTIATWREQSAQQRDVPRKWILTDEVIVELARKQPRNTSELFQVRGLRDRLTQRSAKEILDRIAAVIASDPETWPKLDRHVPQKKVDDSVIELLESLLRLRARENDVTPKFIATRDDLENLASGNRDIDLVRGWRRDLVGDDLVALLDGKLALKVENDGLRVMNV